MCPGEGRQVHIPPEEGYGLHREEMIFKISMDQIPSSLDPQKGQQYQLSFGKNQAVPVVITGVAENAIMVDANHSLAGKTLIFDLTLVRIGD